MSEHVIARSIGKDQLKHAVDLVCFHHGETVEAREPVCEWPNLCDQNFCRFPRYTRNGEPVGLIAHVLVQLGLPMRLLKELDTEYEIGEVLHPGVKIYRSRNPMLERFDFSALRLLVFMQEHQKIGWSWNDIVDAAFRPARMTRFLDKRRRPWLY
jgi:hypothetical protein